MQRALIVTPYTGTGQGGDAYRPLVADAYPLARWQDVTGQQLAQIVPAPNAYSVEAEADTSTLDAIAADGRFGLIWREEVVSGP